jgi:hypothetical protein
MLTSGVRPTNVSSFFVMARSVSSLKWSGCFSRLRILSAASRKVMAPVFTTNRANMWDADGARLIGFSSGDFPGPIF